MAETKPVRIEWELDTSATIDAVWDLFSDTDRYNRAVGFGYVFKDTPRADGTVERTGQATVFGKTLVWDEMPFEYREKQWYRIRRRFRSGPATDVVVTLRLGKRSHGTSIRYCIDVTPRNLLARPIVTLELKKKTRPAIDRTLNAMVASLADPVIAFDPKPPPLTAETLSRIDPIFEQLTDPLFSEKLREMVLTSPLSDQDRMHPLQLASAWGHQEDHTIESMIEAARAGLLTMSWDLICPLCRGAKQRVTTLTAGRTEVHCTSCNVHYDGTYPDSVAVSFRTAPAVREFDVVAACIGSPANQPHVVAQDNIPAFGETTFDLDLELGSYRFRAMPPRDTGSLLIEAGESTGPSTISVNEDGFSPLQLHRGPGPQKIVMTNTTSKPISVAIDRRPIPRHVLSAGRLLRMPGIAVKLPAICVDPTFQFETTHSAILAVETQKPQPGADDPLKSWGEQLDALSVCYQPGRLMVRVADLNAALALIAPYVGKAWMRAAVGDGLTVVVGEDRESPFMGDCVDHVSVAVENAAPGTLVMLEDSVNNHDLGAAGWGLDSGPIPLYPWLSIHRVSPRS